jgi:hypothetical protein
MLKKYLSKFTMDVLPSVVATIVGAYIVNHYIVTKPGAGAPVAAALSAADPKKADVRNDASDVANIPEPGVRAKGFSEKTTIERAAVVEKPAEKPVEKSAEKPADKPAEAAVIPMDTRRRPPAPREKTAKAAPVPPQPAVSAVVPVVSAPNPAPAAEAAVAPEDHRDANDLARAAIERLRGFSDGAPRAQEAARTPDRTQEPAARLPDAPRVVSAPSVPAPAPQQVRPLPPPIMVSTPAGDTFESATGSAPAKPPYAAARTDDPLRPTPPADIPASIPAARPPLDLHADAADPSTHQHTNVAEDMLSAAKSVFHAVLPK